MFSYFKPNCIEHFLGGNDFSNFGHVASFAKRKLVHCTLYIGNHFEKVFSFSEIMVVLCVYRYGASFVPKFLRKSTFFKFGSTVKHSCLDRRLLWFYKAKKKKKKKKKFCVSKLPPAFVFLCAFDFAKFRLSFFFSKLLFVFLFLLQKMNKVCCFGRI